MTQPISSRKASTPDLKSKVNTELYSSLTYDMDNTRNSMGLVYPSVLESFLQDTHTAFQLSKRKTNLSASENNLKTINIREYKESRLGTFSRSKNSVAERTANFKKNELLPTRVSRSAGKYAEFNSELKSLSNFRIDDIAWYYEDEFYYKRKMHVVLSDFAIPKENRRDGNQQLYYTYLLLDSRKCRNKANISWQDFIEAIFYIGKGQNQRAFQHAEEAEELLSDTSDKKKCLKIKEIWNSGNPVKVFFVTEDVIAEEAYTREAAMIDAMGLKRLCNVKRGSYYGGAVTMKERERLELGATLLVEARDIFRWKKAVAMYPKTKSVMTSFVRPRRTTSMINLKQSYKNEERTNERTMNRGKSIENVVPRIEEKEESCISLAEEKSPASSKIFDRSNSKTLSKIPIPRTVITTDIKNGKSKIPIALESKNVIAKINLNVTSNKDFSLENMDWYYNSENDYEKKLEIVLSDFAIPKTNRREGNERVYYNFLLLDSRRCKNKITISWIDFIEAIFYIGKGKNDSAVRLTEEAGRALNRMSNKQLYLKIKDIWDSGNPVEVFLVTENIIAEEAYTRSAAMIDAMGLNRLCNERCGTYYEKAKTMKTRERLELGATLLVEARDKFVWKKTIDVYPKKTPAGTLFVRSYS